MPVEEPIDDGGDLEALGPVDHGQERNGLPGGIRLALVEHRDLQAQPRESSTARLESGDQPRACIRCRFAGAHHRDGLLDAAEPPERTEAGSGDEARIRLGDGEAERAGGLTGPKRDEHETPPRAALDGTGNRGEEPLQLDGGERGGEPARTEGGRVSGKW